MSAPKISVIIPVYNSMQTLLRCADSVLTQSLSELEAIFVDDRSTDGSLALIEEYARRDARVRVIPLEKNAGAGNARNVGIEAARGEYLAFVDSDDAIAPDFLELLYDAASKSGADVIKGSCLDLREDGIGDDCSVERMGFSNNMFMGLLNSRRRMFLVFNTRHFSAIFRRSFILGNGIRYGSTAVGEDSTFLLKVGVFAGSIRFVQNAVYRHYLRPSSLTYSLSLERFDAVFGALVEQLEFLETAGVDTESAAAFIAKKFAFALRLQLHLRTLEGFGDYAESFAKRVYELASGCRYAELLPKRDYAVGVFLRSHGETNIVAFGPAFSLADNIELRLADLRRLAEHLAEERFNTDEGMLYLYQAMTYILTHPPCSETRPLMDFRASMIESMHQALAAVNTPELLARMHIGVRAIAEYGADIFPPYHIAGITQKADLLLAELENTVKIYDGHPDAAPEYLIHADSLRDMVLWVSLAIAKKMPEKSKFLLRQSELLAERLRPFKQKPAEGGGSDEA
ncbi:MAG: glycosyltransferase family 2 protein [Clostridia bacterium]|nr:glycosyltransferase family 2 protein [Clostridia bacterium]